MKPQVILAVAAVMLTPLLAGDIVPRIRVARGAGNSIERVARHTYCEWTRKIEREVESAREGEPLGADRSESGEG